MKSGSRIPASRWLFCSVRTAETGSFLRSSASAIARSPSHSSRASSVVHCVNRCIRDSLPKLSAGSAYHKAFLSFRVRYLALGISITLTRSEKTMDLRRLRDDLLRWLGWVSESSEKRLINDKSSSIDDIAFSFLVDSFRNNKWIRLTACCNAVDESMTGPYNLSRDKTKWDCYHQKGGRCKPRGLWKCVPTTLHPQRKKFETVPNVQLRFWLRPRNAIQRTRNFSISFDAKP